MFVIDLIRETLISPTQHRNAITPEMKVFTKIFVFWQMGKYNK